MLGCAAWYFFTGAAHRAGIVSFVVGWSGFFSLFFLGVLVRGGVSASSPCFCFTPTFWLYLIVVLEKLVEGAYDGFSDLQVILEQIHCAGES